jgi:hypothetical protein|tara:strand:- start:97 stop:534 length:438 start_codon:yes stop_codon:yes gene_type:complete
MDNTITKISCPCCKETFDTEEEKVAHIKEHHEYHRLTPQPKIGRKYQRIVGQIEKCFYAYRKNNVEVLTVTQIESWLKDNTKSGLAKQRISSLLRRRPQFLMHRKARRINSNEMETWWSLGEIDKDIDYSGYSRWVDVETHQKLN